MKQIVFILALLLPICGFAQFSDDFSNSDLNQNWKGNISKFSIKDGQLWLDAEPGKAGIASIYHEYIVSPTMEWTFDVLLNVNPSSQNKVVIYPCYNPENDDYIYLNVGASKNADLDLFRKGGISILDNKPRELPYLDFPCVVHIKLTLENGEKWTLYSSLNGVEYTKEGEGIYDVANPDNNVLFHIQIEYTKTRYDSFGIDNVRISDTISETPLKPEDDTEDAFWKKPVLEEIYQVSSSSLLFEFNKEIDYSEAIVNLSEIGQAIRFDYNQEIADNSEVIASFLADFESGKEYKIHIEGFKDMDGIFVPSTDEILCFLDDEEDEEDESDTDIKNDEEIPDEAVYISEIMADPKGSMMPETEYVELYNSYEKAVSLKNWNMIYRGEVHTDLSPVVIPANSYVVIYREGDEMKDDLLDCSFALEDFPANLANTGQSLQLVNSMGKVVDDVDYPKAKPGVSWEKGEDGWALSTNENGGTPGAMNSSPLPDSDEEDQQEEGDNDKDEEESSLILIAEGDIIINELLPNPFSGGSEYVELYNRSDKFLPLSGLALSTRKSDGEFRTVYKFNSSDITLESGEYVVLTSNADGVVDYYYTPDESLVREVKMPVLSNDGATLVLYNASDSSVVDEVSYDDKWHSDMIKDEKGVSLERINPDGPSNDAENWTSASEGSGYGTPGYINSQYLKEKPEDEPLGVEKPYYSPADGLYSIPYQLDKAGYMSNIYIYDISGRLQASPFVKYSVGTNGILQWNGMDGGRKLEPGVYILFVEMFHPEGDVYRKKTAFLVR